MSELIIDWNCPQRELYKSKYIREVQKRVLHETNIADAKLKIIHDHDMLKDLQTKAIAKDLIDLITNLELLVEP